MINQITNGLINSICGNAGVSKLLRKSGSRIAEIPQETRKNTGCSG